MLHAQAVLPNFSFIDRAHQVCLLADCELFLAFVRMLLSDKRYKQKITASKRAKWLAGS